MAKLISLDIETTGLRPYVDDITCIGGYSDDGDWTNVYRNVARFHNSFRRRDEDWGLFGHNFKFDIHFLVTHGVHKQFLLDHWSDDTQLMSHVWTEKVPEKYLEWYAAQRVIENKKLPVGYSHRPARGNSLKVLAPYWLGVPPFWENPADYDNDEYVLKDCKYTYELRKFFERKLRASGQYSFYKEKMMPWVKMLLDCELRGIKLSWPNLIQTEAELTEAAGRLSRELDQHWCAAHIKYRSNLVREIVEKYTLMKDTAVDKLKKPTQMKVNKTINRYDLLSRNAEARIDQKLNYQSPKQMTWLLKDHLGLDIKTVEGEESTGKAVLERLSQKRDDVKTFLEFRKTSKLLTAFIPTYKELQIDGIIHPTFKITGTRTGRLSSSEPNMQQVPPTLYNIFTPRPGYKFIQYDLSGIEAALIAYYSEDKELFKIVSSGQSIHNANAKVFFDLSCDTDLVKDKYPDQRYASKHVGFALFYGAGWRRIKHTFANFGFMVTDDQAKQMHKNFKKHYFGAIRYHRELTKTFEAGEVIHNIMGRPVAIPEIEDCYMKGFNTLVQSSASDLCLEAGRLATEAWSTQNLDSQILLFIHDCILAEVKDEDATQADVILRDSMTGFNLTNTLGRVNLEVEGGIKTSWQKD